MVLKTDFASYKRQSFREILIPKKYRKVEEEIPQDEVPKNIEVEHSVINFEKVIIGEKIRNI